MGPIFRSAAHVRINSTLNLVCDGNSLTAGTGGAPWPSIMGAEPAFAGVSITNTGIAGQTTAQMTAAASDVDSAWNVAKTNVLVAWEGTNSICNVARTAVQAAQDMADYIAARLALHPWRVLIGTCLPRQTNLGQAQTTAQNAVIDAYNALLRANFKSMGAHGLFDVRAAGSPFNIADYNNATFEALASNGQWASGETGNHIHLSIAGYTILESQFVQPALRRLPLR